MVNIKNDQLNQGSVEPESVGKTLTQFSQDSSMHAVKYIGDFKRPRWRRWSWILIFLLLLTGFSFVMIDQLHVIWTRPTLSKLTTRFYKHLPIPAVTICNFNGIKRSYVTKDPLIRTVVNGLNYEFNTTVFTEMPEEVYRSINLTRIAVEGSATLDETILSCTFDVGFICKTHFERITTEFGECFMLNTSSHIHGDSFNSGRVGPLGGFAILVDVQSQEYFKSSYGTAVGVKVIIHDPHDAPIPTMSGFALKPGTSNFIGLNMKKAKYLPRPVQAFGDDYCYDTNADDFVNPLVTAGRYTVEACQYECLMNSIAEACGCRMNGHKGSIPECDVIETINCALMIIENTNTSGDTLTCDCRGPCETTEYRLSLSSADITGASIVNYLKTEFPSTNSWINLTKFREDYIYLYVYYETFMVELVEQVEDYTLGDILASVGGHLGLFLGASLASVVELVEVLIITLVSYCKRINVRTN